MMVVDKGGKGEGGISLLRACFCLLLIDRTICLLRLTKRRVFRLFLWVVAAADRCLLRGSDAFCARKILT